MKEILLIFGGDSPESDVSIISGYQAYQNLDAAKYKVYPIYYHNGKLYYIPTFNLKIFQNFTDNDYKETHIIDKRAYVIKHKRFKPISGQLDCALLTLHGGGGEGGEIQGYLEVLNLPYTSASVLSSAVSLNKYVSKMLASSLSVPVLDCVYITKQQYVQNGVKGVKEKLNAENIIVKPNSMGSSIGISVTNLDGINEAIESALNYDTEVILESCIQKIEYNCAAFSYRDKLILSEVEQVKADGKMYSFAQKYQSDRPCGAICDDTEVSTKVRELTEKIYRGFGLSGVARIDYLYDTDSKKLYFNEINTIPGSLAFPLFKDKFSYSEMLDMLIDEAIFIKRHNAGNNKKFKSDILYKNNYFCLK